MSYSSGSGAVVQRLSRGGWWAWSESGQGGGGAAEREEGWEAEGGIVTDAIEGKAEPDEPTTGETTVTATCRVCAKTFGYPEEFQAHPCALENPPKLPPPLAEFPERSKREELCGICGGIARSYEDCCVDVSWCPVCGAFREDAEWIRPDASPR